MKSTIILLTAITTFALGAEGELKWKFQTGGEILTSPAIGPDSTIYVKATDNYLYAINPDGTLKWKYETVWTYTFELSPSIGPDGTIYFGGSDYLYALNPDGSLKWQYETGRVPKTPAFGSDSTIYVSDDNELFALTPSGHLKWKYTTSSSEITSPVIDTLGTIYVGGISLDTGAIYAINPNGTLRWEYPTKDMIYCSHPSISYGGMILFGAFDRYLFVLNPDGTFKWKFDVGEQPGYRVCFPPSTGEDSTIYFGIDGFNYKFYALNQDGTLKRQYPIRSAYSSPAIGADGLVYVAGTDDYLYALDPETFTTVWRFWIDGSVHSSPAIADDGTLYIGSIGSWDGESPPALYAIECSSQGLANSPWPKFRYDNRNSGRTEPVKPPGIVEQPEPISDLKLSASGIADRISVDYTLPEGQNGVLRVYDALGRRVEQMKVRSSGEVEFTASLNSGVYFIQLEAMGKRGSSKVVLLP